MEKDKFEERWRERERREGAGGGREVGRGEMNLKLLKFE